MSVLAESGYGRVFTIREAVELSRTHSVIASGSEAIDTLLDGGYRIGEIVELYGESKTGKTQLAMQAAISCAALGSSVLYVDTESTFRPERIEAIARARGLRGQELLRRIYRMKAPDPYTQIEASKLVRTKVELAESRLIVVDTVTKNFSVAYPGRENIPNRQGLLSVYLGELARDAYLKGRAVLLTNRVTAFRTAGGGREAHVGGETLSQFVHRVIHLTRVGEKVRASIMVGTEETRSVEGVIVEAGFR